MFYCLERQTHLNFTETTISNCHDITGITVYYFIIGIFSCLRHGHHGCFSNDFKLIEAIVSFMFFWEMRLGFPPLLHYTCNYNLLLVLWFLLFSIFFGLEKGTHTFFLSKNVIGKQLVLSLNAAFHTCSILSFLQSFCLVSSRLNIVPFTFIIVYIGFCGTADNQRWLFHVQFHSFH